MPSPSYGHLQVVDPKFSKAGSRQFVPPKKTGVPRLSCLQGAKLGPWRPLAIEQRLIDVRLFLDAETGRYRAELSQAGLKLEPLVFGRRERAHLICWFDVACSPGSSAGIRVPWSAIDRGEIWSRQICFRDYFFELRAERCSRERVQEENSKVLSKLLLS